MATTHIIAVGKMSQGHAEFRVAPTFTEIPAPDGTLQALSDAGEALAAAEDALVDVDFEAELADLREGMLDDEYHSRGDW